MFVRRHHVCRVECLWWKHGKRLTGLYPIKALGPSGFVVSVLQVMLWAETFSRAGLDTSVSVYWPRDTGSTCQRLQWRYVWDVRRIGDRIVVRHGFRQYGASAKPSGE